jgi:hypothetical protein
MHIDTQNQEMPLEPVSAVRNQEARLAAERWLAGFSPLLDRVQTLDSDECRRWVTRVPHLRAEGQFAREELQQHGSQADGPLLTTLGDALTELDNLENDLRLRLGHLTPGDPEGRVDLERLQAKLAESQARREVGSWGTQDGLLGPRLEMLTSEPNWAAAAAMGIFSLGWNSFTTIHAVLFIGGFMKAIGLFALFFLAFYSMFWAVGLAMAFGAFMAACREQVIIEDGRKLTLIRKLLGFAWKRDYTLMPGARAELMESRFGTQKRHQAAATNHEIAIVDEKGKEIRFASGRNIGEQQRLLKQLNEYLTAQGA